MTFEKQEKFKIVIKKHFLTIGCTKEGNAGQQPQERHCAKDRITDGRKSYLTPKHGFTHTNEGMRT